MNIKTQVYLVGAGPGDTDLITVKGLRCLQQADVVLYDKLSNPAFLDEVPSHAEQIYVGKIKGHHSMAQRQINELLVEKALTGDTVVRLKGGDPYIFGRGGEEAQHLKKAGIRFEVVPGITSGFAAATYAGIPLTHRDFNTSVSLITGHVNTRKNEQADINWPALASGNGTLVFYMGLGNITAICQQLIAHGRPANTPVAIISQATTAHQQTVVACLNDAPQQVALNNIETPALIIVGDVVSLRDQLRWFEDKPLFGQRILIPHTQSGASALCERLKELGAEPVRCRVSEEIAPNSWQELDAALDQLYRVNLLLLSTPTMVKKVWQRLRVAGKDARALNGITLVVTGDKTAQALRHKGLEPDLHLSNSAEDSTLDSLLLAALKSSNLAHVHILYPRDENKPRADLQQVKQAGATIEQPVAVATITALKHRPWLEEQLRTGQFNALCLTCTIGTYALAEILGSASLPLLAPLHTVVIDSKTEHATQQCGIKVDSIARRATLEDMVQACLPDIYRVTNNI